MAKSKLRLTGFARFLLMMIILAPLAYLGASYYNGQDGIQNIKNLVGLGDEAHVSNQVNPQESVESSTPATTRPAPSKEYVDSQVKKLSDDLAEKEARLEELYLENEELKKQLREKTKELTEVKDQFDKIRSALGQ